MRSDPIQEFIDAFSHLPSIGPRQATRLAFYLVNSGKKKIEELQLVIHALSNVKLCSQCFFAHQRESSECHICGNAERAKNIVAITEKATDIISLEQARIFHGRYFILGEFRRSGILSPLHKERLEILKTQAKRAGGFEEIILALSPTTQGDMNASLIAEELKPFAKKISRLARGIPTGGEIEFADEETLKEALRHRE